MPVGCAFDAVIRPCVYKNVALVDEFGVVFLKNRFQFGVGLGRKPCTQKDAEQQGEKISPEVHKSQKGLMDDCWVQAGIFNFSSCVDGVGWSTRRVRLCNRPQYGRKELTVFASIDKF